eukprot:GHVO01046239.1.p2 GENE.GHVO01046239.1~~GHVO01046239.1.p2  ORF type:complete len:199 (-),score=41.12 GHVO01046239.1:1234-1830(-)
MENSHLKAPHFFEYLTWQPRFEDKPVNEVWEEITEDGDAEEESESGSEANSSVAPGGTEEEKFAQLVAEDQLLKDFKAAGNGETVDVDTAVKLTRELGIAPSNKAIEEAKESTNNKMTFNVFEDFVKSSTHPEDQPEYISKMFAFFDVDKTGTLRKAQVKNILMMLGEPLTANQADDLLKSEAEPIDYKQFAQKLLEK